MQHRKTDTAVGRIIDALGGSSLVAKALGMNNPQAVTMWIKRNTVPSKHVEALCSFAHTRNVPLQPHEVRGE